MDLSSYEFWSGFAVQQCWGVYNCSFLSWGMCGQAEERSVALTLHGFPLNTQLFFFFLFVEAFTSSVTSESMS